MILLYFMEKDYFLFSRHYMAIIKRCRMWKWKLKQLKNKDKISDVVSNIKVNK